MLNALRIDLDTLWQYQRPIREAACCLLLAAGVDADYHTAYTWSLGLWALIRLSVQASAGRVGGGGGQFIEHILKTIMGIYTRTLSLSVILPYFYIVSHRYSIVYLHLTDL